MSHSDKKTFPFDEDNNSVPFDEENKSTSNYRDHENDCLLSFPGPHLQAPPVMFYHPPHPQLQTIDCIRALSKMTSVKIGMRGTTIVHSHALACPPWKQIDGTKKPKFDYDQYWIENPKKSSEKNREPVEEEIEDEKNETQKKIGSHNLQEPRTTRNVFSSQRASQRKNYTIASVFPPFQLNSCTGTCGGEEAYSETDSAQPTPCWPPTSWFVAPKSPLLLTNQTHDQVESLGRARRAQEQQVPTSVPAPKAHKHNSTNYTDDPPTGKTPSFGQRACIMHFLLD